MITPQTSMQVASDAARRINEIGPWKAVPFDGKRQTAFGVEDVVGFAVFEQASEHRIVSEMANMPARMPRSAVVLVWIQGNMVDVFTRSQSRLPEAQLVRRLVLDAASEQAPIVDDVVEAWASN